MRKLLVIGAGRMGSALVGGLLASGALAAEEIAVTDIVAAARDALAAARPGVVVSPVPVAAEGTVIAVKPADLEAACVAARDSGAARVLSIVAGVTTERLEELIGGTAAVIRAMPNTPALVGQGASAIAAGSSAGPDDLDWAGAILRSVGVVVELPEKLLDAVTGLSGSGPAYVFLVAEALIDGGVAAGLDRATARTLVAATLTGSARLLAESGEQPEQLRAAVTSPGGTTAAGLRVLEQRALRVALIDAVAAATERSRELGSAH